MRWPGIRQPDPDHGRTCIVQSLAQREVFVLRYDGSILPQRAFPDHGIGRSFELPVGDMLGLVPVGRKPSRKSGRKLRIHKKTHQATRRTG